MPLALFRVAMMAVAARIEGMVFVDGDDEAHNAVHDSLRTPIEVAAAHPYWRDPDDERNDLRLGFTATAVATALDRDPDSLRPREQPRAEPQPGVVEMIEFGKEAMTSDGVRIGVGGSLYIISNTKGVIGVGVLAILEPEHHGDPIEIRFRDVFGCEGTIRAEATYSTRAAAEAARSPSP